MRASRLLPLFAASLVGCTYVHEPWNTYYQRGAPITEAAYLRTRAECDRGVGGSALHPDRFQLCVHEAGLAIYHHLPGYYYPDELKAVRPLSGTESAR